MRLVLLFSLLVSTAPGVAPGAAAQPPRQPAAAAGRSTEVAAAKRALTAGRGEEAVTLADRVLVKEPGHDDAVEVKIDALLSLDRFTPALDAYDAWFKVTQREHVALASRLGRAALEALARGDLAAIRIDAIGALAAAGAPESRKTLEREAWAAPPTAASWPSLMMLAEVGDAKAQARVLEAAKASTGSAKVGAIAALAAARVGGSEEVLRESLRARDANIQAAAAEAAATLGLTALVPDLERVAKEGEQFGRFVAAVSAMKLGGRGVDAIVEAGLTSPAPDARLLAASALKARGRSTWVEATRPLLQDLDGVTRFKAAELLLSVDRKPAFDVLMAGTVDPNIAVRAEVARILAADPNLDLAQFRRLLRDGAPRVRLEAARALLNRTQPPARRQ
jgi:hypothetical protein